MSDPIKTDVLMAGLMPLPLLAMASSMPLRTAARMAPVAVFLEPMPRALAAGLLCEVVDGCGHRGLRERAQLVHD
jgi:hypothetical protein